MMRWVSAGESHGQALVGIIDGVPAGVPVTTEMIEFALARRRTGYGRGARQKFEEDRVRLLGGVRHGRSLGSPIAVEIANSEWPKWTTVMSPDPVSAEDLTVDAGRGDEREAARNRPLTRPRPGHADLGGMFKYGHQDARNVLERASARETATRVALGEVARSLLREVAGIEVISQVVAVGPTRPEAPARAPLPTEREKLDASVMRTLDPQVEAHFIDTIDQARRAGDTVGGEVEVLAYGVPVGLGSYQQWDRRLDARLAGALMSIPSVKSVTVGSEQVAAFGTAAHDEILPTPGLALLRTGNRAGGIEGGMSNGEVIDVQVGFKPISTVPKARRTIDLATGEAATANHQRSDVCQVVPGAVIAEAMTCLTLAGALTDMFGEDSCERIQRGLALYNDEVHQRLEGS